MTRPALDPDFDPRIADFLEGDPDRAPDAVLETVLAAFPSIPQRRAVRVPWRTRPMNRILIAAAAATTTVAVVVAVSLLAAKAAVGPAASGRPSVQPSGSVAATLRPSATSSPTLMATVSSASGDLTIRYPSTWSIRGSSSNDQPGSIGAEHVTDPGHAPETFFVGWSVPLPDGTSPDRWIADQAATQGQVGCGSDGGSDDVVIGGHSGVLLAGGCPILGGRLHYFAVVVVNGRGYSFHMDTRTSLLGDASFSSLLAEVSFGP